MKLFNGLSKNPYEKVNSQLSQNAKHNQDLSDHKKNEAQYRYYIIGNEILNYLNMKEFK